MGCPTAVTIGHDLTFSICTHDPDTGELTDTDTTPPYRVYENETAVAIITGTMAKLDDAGTTGFYAVLLACTAANGFENGNTYTVYIEATVDGDTGGISYGIVARDALKVDADVSDALVGAAALGDDLAADITLADVLAAGATLVDAGAADVTLDDDEIAGLALDDMTKD